MIAEQVIAEKPYRNNKTLLFCACSVVEDRQILKNDSELPVNLTNLNLTDSIFSFCPDMVSLLEQTSFDT